MNDLTKYAPRAAQRIVTKLVNECLDRGHKLSVCDGEEWTVKRSQDRKEVLNALASTDFDWLRVYDAGNRVGTFMLIYENDEDVISDYSWNPNNEGSDRQMDALFRLVI